MATGDKINGDAFMFHIWDDAAYRPIACITSNDISSSAEVTESKNKCAPGVVSTEYGAINKSASIEGEFIDTTSAGGDSTKASFDFLEGKQDAKQKVDIKIDFGLEDSSSKYAKAIISDLQLTGPAGEVSTFSATLNIDGGYVADPHA